MGETNKSVQKFAVGNFLAVITPVFSVAWSFRNHSHLLKKHFLFYQC